MTAKVGGTHSCPVRLRAVKILAAAAHSTDSENRQTHISKDLKLGLGEGLSARLLLRAATGRSHGFGKHRTLGRHQAQACIAAGSSP